VNRARIAKQHLIPELAHQTPKPTEVSRGLHTDAHLAPGQRSIERLGFGGVSQPALSVLSSFLVKVRNLLELRMKITSYNQHLGSFAPERLGRFAATSLLGERGADAVM
jgi:hypothetical protein